MNPWVAFFIGLIVGGVIGWFGFAIFSLGKVADVWFSDGLKKDKK